MGRLLRCLVLGAIVSAAGCASVEYRVPTWEVARLTQVPPALRGGEVRVVPADVVVPPPPPPAPVAVTPPAPPSEDDVDDGVDVDIDVPVVVASAPPPVVVVPRPVAVRRPVAAPVVTNTRPAPPVRGGWKTASTTSTGSGGWRGSAPSAARPSIPRGSSSGGGWHGGGGGHRGGGGGGGGNAAAAAAGAVAAVALIAIVADAAAANAAAADAARLYNGWVTVAAAHPLRLYYGGDKYRIVPLARLAPADLVGLQYAVLEEEDGHVEPLRQAPPPGAAPPPVPPPPAAPPPVAMSPPAPATPPGPVPPPAPVRQAIDAESP